MKAMKLWRLAFAMLASVVSLTANAQTEIEGRGMSQVGYNEQPGTMANHHTAGAVNLSLTKSLMADRLSIQLRGTDLLLTEKHGTVMYAGSMQTEQISWYDSRQFVLTLRYKFNTTRSKYKGTGAGNDEKNRL